MWMEIHDYMNSLLDSCEVEFLETGSGCLEKGDLSVHILTMIKIDDFHQGLAKAVYDAKRAQAVRSEPFQVAFQFFAHHRVLRYFVDGFFEGFFEADVDAFQYLDGSA